VLLEGVLFIVFAGGVLFVVSVFLFSFDY